MSLLTPLLRRPAVFVPALIILLVILILGILEFTDKTYILHDKPASTASQYTKGEPKNPDAVPDSSKPTNSNDGSIDEKGNSGSNGQKDSNQTPGDTSGAGPQAPSGSFVSNYTPNLSGSPKPNLMQSVCNTTPGATCKISFTKDGITKSLKEMTADGGGAAYWTWKLQDIGLTEGQWTINAISSLNGKTASTPDTLPLEIKP